MRRWLGIVAVVGIGCASSGDDGQDTDDTDVVDAACAAIVGRAFASLEEGECGLGPDGVVLCTWHVTFTATTWDWQHSDYGMSGDYTCADGVITATSSGGSATVSGAYDVGTDTLTWDGVAYR